MHDDRKDYSYYILYTSGGRVHTEKSVSPSKTSASRLSAAAARSDEDTEAGAVSDYDATARPKIFDMFEKPPESFEDLL